MSPRAAAVLALALCLALTASAIRAPTNRIRRVGRVLRDSAPLAESTEADSIDLPVAEPHLTSVDGAAFDQAARSEGDIHSHSSSVKNNPDAAWAAHIYPAPHEEEAEPVLNDVVSYLGSVYGDAVPSGQVLADMAKAARQATQTKLKRTRGSARDQPRFAASRSEMEVTVESQAQAQALAAAVADLKSLGIDTALAPGFVVPQRDPSRVYPEAPCNHCQRVSRAWAQQVIAGKLTRYDSVVRFQSLCQREALGKFLGVKCEAFEDVQAWLVKGSAIVMNETLFTDKELNRVEFVRNSPAAFCIMQNLCGPNTSDLNPLAATDAQRTGAVLVRVRLQPTFNLSSLQGTPAFGGFVKAFLHDLANVLDCSPRRFQLHLHKKEPPAVKPRPVAPRGPNVTQLLLNLSSLLPNLKPTILANGSYVYNLTELVQLTQAPLASVAIDLPAPTVTASPEAAAAAARFMQILRANTTTATTTTAPTTAPTTTTTPAPTTTAPTTTTTAPTSTTAPPTTATTPAPATAAAPALTAVTPTAASTAPTTATPAPTATSTAPTATTAAPSTATTTASKNTTTAPTTTTPTTTVPTTTAPTTTAPTATAPPAAAANTTTAAKPANGTAPTPAPAPAPAPASANTTAPAPASTNSTVAKPANGTAPAPAPVPSANSTAPATNGTAAKPANGTAANATAPAPANGTAVVNATLSRNSTWISVVNASVNGTLPTLTPQQTQLLRHLLAGLRAFSNETNSTAPAGPANATVSASSLASKLAAAKPLLVINPPKKPKPPPKVAMGQLIEVVIKRFGYDDTNARLTPNQRGRLSKGDRMSPEELANRLGELMDLAPSPLQSATRFTALIDLHFRPQIIPLTIAAPTTVPGERK